MNKINPTGNLETDIARRSGRLDESRGGSSTAAPLGRGARDSDSVDLSSTSSDVARLAAKAADSSDIRYSRVEALRALVQAGNYNPTGRAVADAIIRDERG